MILCLLALVRGFSSVDSLILPDLDGSKGFEIDGDSLLDNAGYSVSSAGDFNGDGFGDLIIGAPSSDSDTGASYILYIWYKFKVKNKSNYCF